MTDALSTAINSVRTLRERTAQLEADIERTVRSAFERLNDAEHQRTRYEGFAPYRIPADQLTNAANELIHTLRMAFDWRESEPTGPVRVATLRDTFDAPAHELGCNCGVCIWGKNSLP